MKKKFGVDIGELMREADEAKKAELDKGFVPMGSPDDWPEGDDRKEDNVDGWRSRDSTLHEDGFHWGTGMPRY